MLKTMYQSLVDLVFPHLCLSCGRDTIPNEDILCLSCAYELPKSKQHFYADNRFTDRFWGRINIHSAGAYMYFKKQGTAQKLMSKLKYQGHWQIGFELGRKYGKILTHAELFAGIDLIIPIPLHSSKLKTRGFNQSEVFARGLSEVMDIPNRSAWMKRIIKTPTQTTKTRMERFANVEHAFRITKPNQLKGKHILLVDDVLTTGATLEAAGKKILEIPGTKLSMACIAMAEHI